MARIPRNTVGGMIYHVLNRANGREKLFKKEKDYLSFENIIFEAKEKYPNVDIFSFCIMPNHWHFALQPKRGEDLSMFMRWLTHTHTQRYHTHYKSIGYGHVYQGRYKSFPVSNDDYFLKLVRYIERNPLRARLVKKAENWRWSSLWYREKGGEEQKKILTKWPLEYDENYLKWVNQKKADEDEELEKIRNSIQRGRPFGIDTWIKELSKKLGLESTIKPRGRPKKGA
jgi:putative transposase